MSMKTLRTRYGAMVAGIEQIEGIIKRKNEKEAEEWEIAMGGLHMAALLFAECYEQEYPEKAMQHKHTLTQPWVRERISKLENA